MEKTIDKLGEYINEEFEKTMFIMKGIESMEFLNLLSPHPAIRNFIEVFNKNKSKFVEVVAKLETCYDMEPKEYLYACHFLYELFEATDEAYVIFLKTANDLKED